MAYNFGPNGRPSNLSEWGIPAGNNYGSSCGTTWPGEDNNLIACSSFFASGTEVLRSDEQSLTFDSYTTPEDDPELGQSRLLEVDNRVVVPAKTHIRIIVTSADVLHSWVVPSSGVKCDAVPGRLNQTSILVQRDGVYYGWSFSNKKGGKVWHKAARFREARGALLTGSKPGVKRRDWISPMISD
uniref:Cytochrome c oxidase polypeptide II n=1 Tax=Chenopodium quinoa TaxID=63459 RepID=A0A803KRG8_CHEQI